MNVQRFLIRIYRQLVTFVSRINWLFIAYLLIFEQLVVFVGIQIDGAGHTLTADTGGYESPFVSHHIPLYIGIVSTIGQLLLAAAVQIYRKRNIPSNGKKENVFLTIYHTLPEGLRTSLVGALLLAISFPADIAWHIIFGFEQRAEAEISPTHLVLISGMIIVNLGVAHFGWLQRQTEKTLNWRQGAIVVLPTVLALAMLGAILHSATPVGQMVLLGTEPPQHTVADAWWPLQYLIAVYVLWPIIVTPMLLPITRKFQLPTGTFFLAVVISSFTQAIFDPISPLRGIGAMVLAGVAIEVVYRRIHPWNGSWLRPLSFFVLLSGLVATAVVMMTWASVGMWLRIHGWLGLIVISMICGGVMVMICFRKFPIPYSINEME
jgi:hypothetical protein